jgi:hypothetical protein
MKTIELNTSNEFNLLRHFDIIDEAYKKSLFNKEYFYHNHLSGRFEKGIINEEAINNALKTQNSKFFRNIKGLETPKDILNLVKDKFEQFKLEEIKWKSSEKKFFTFLITYKEPVGIKNLIHINDLSEEDRRKVKTVPRSNKVGETEIMINVISGVKAKPINTIEVGIQDSPELSFYLVNAYPGDLEQTSAFPSSRQSKEKYAKSVEYWQNHVFII